MNTMTKVELISKLEQIIILLDDVDEWARHNNNIQIDRLIMRADSCIWEALDTIPDTITNN